MIRYRIIVKGDVQGVGFRFFTQKTALIYGVNGWVKNKYDGSVEIDAEGSECSIAGFIEAIQQGSRYSRVESVSK
jgi:acylphosphatase